ncbi:hypothetical protein RND71_004325 [Anisodus tanguticus]|uniref:Guanylate kinase-like domain-containing protein n=1 Tax=Anisodus tanguticus TaxID=243964 RepID=A0AAE1SWC2_9SOLA|nr:hypothetical protein RND71_004325 [Anisodus tanguticus]
MRRRREKEDFSDGDDGCAVGETPAFFADNLLGDFPKKVDSKFKANETAIVVGSKIYVINGVDPESGSTIGVRIFDKTSGEWINPIVLGTKPEPSKHHSVVLLNDDRVLVVRGSSTFSECFWFLEVGTPFVSEQENTLGNEVVVWSKGVLGNVEKPIVISGPSGVGKEAVKVVADAGKRSILDIDVQGARSVKASTLDAIFIFVSPPPFEELEKRLRARATETEEQIQKRLRNARAELEQGKSSGLFYHILVNDDLETCYEKLKNILCLSEDVKSARKTFPESIDLSIEHSVSKIDQNLLINCSTAEHEKASMYVLDLSLLKGGAPGRTRGLNMYANNPLAGDVNSDNQLS